MRDDLVALRDWLKEAGVTQVAMESTGVYWKPVYETLERDFETIVVNAQHIKNVPGRKTDVKDCEWISHLLRHGLLRPGFVPPRDIRDLRELNRYRRKVAQVQAGERNRLIKYWKTAGIKLAGVVSDVFGVSGRAMIRALIEGEDMLKVMAELARGTLRRKRVDLARALNVPLKPHQRFMLRTQAGPHRTGRGRSGTDRRDAEGDDCPLRPLRGTADEHPRRRLDHRRHHNRRDWRGYERVRLPGAPRLLDRHLSGGTTKAPARSDPERPARETSSSRPPW